MILSREMILRDVKFDPPLDAFQVQACAIDLRLGEDVSFDGLQHKIAKTLERITMPKDVVGIIFPRSSLNRMNITLDPTGLVDPGYEGTLVLPLTNWGKEQFLNKGVRVASIVFHTLYSVVDARESKYHKGDGALVPDKEEEMLFVDNRDIDGLKKKYPA